MRAGAWLRHRRYRSSNLPCDINHGSKFSMSSVIRGNRRKAPEQTTPTGQRTDVPLGKLLLDAGKLTEIDVNRVAVAQRQKNLRFGEMAERLGLVSHEDVARALAQQFRY